MVLELKRPLIILDIETTGIDLNEDRIIQLACVKIGVDGKKSEFMVDLDPERPISAEASKVHGFVDADMVDRMKFYEICNELWEYLSGCDIGGYNVEKFDLPIIIKEFERCGLSNPFIDCKVVDSYLIFRKAEKKDLSSAVKFYLGKEHVDSHDALGDVKVVVDILDVQIEKYSLAKTVDELHIYCHDDKKTRLGNKIDEDGKFVQVGDKVLFSIGKYFGKCIDDIVIQDRRYLEWMLGNNNFNESTKAVIYAAFDRCGTGGIKF